MAVLTSAGARKQLVSMTIQSDTTQVLEFEATLVETHIGDAVTTDYPVEAGADGTDHVRRLPEQFQLVGVVSDTPIVFLSSVRAEPSIPGGDPGNRAQDAYGFVKGIKDAGLLVQVTTTLRDYVNLAIVGLTVIRDKDSSKIVEMNLSFKEILIATTEQVESPEPINQSRKKKKKQGKKQKAASAESASSKSILTSVFGVIGG